MQAFETNSIDYIVKPIKAERILKSIERLDSLKRHSDKQELLRIIKIDDAAQTMLQSGCGYYEQAKRLMEI